MAALIVWRHPAPIAVAGRCIGRTDVPVDRRKAKRLAHRIRDWARRHDAPREIVTSPLQRGRDVARWLVRWGWVARIDARLSELDFGRWEGRRWDDIGAAAVDAWCADFAAHRPGGGEAVAALLERCAAFIAEQPPDRIACVVGHAGWISAATWLQARPPQVPHAATWPRAIGYGQQARIECY